MADPVVTRGVAASIAAILFAYLLLMFADGGGSLRTALQVFALGIWIVAPVAGGLVTRRAVGKQAVRVAATAGWIVAALVVIVLLFGPRTGRSCFEDWSGAGLLFMATAIAAAAVMGAGFGTGLFASTQLAARGGWTGWIGSAVAGCVLHLGTSALGYWLVYNVAFCAIPVGRA